MKRSWSSKVLERAFIWTCLASILIPIGLLLLLLGDIAAEGLARVDFDFLTGFPSRRASKAGIFPALVGSVYLIALTAAIAIPIGVGSAIYLEEYGKQSRAARIIELNIANLAGVPSIIYGLLGLGLFVRTLGMGQSLLAGACTLALLVLPIVIVASREALRTVPYRLREAALGLGATQWQTVRYVVLPSAVPGILTGTILAVSRGFGETAPLIVVGALTYVTFLPDGVTSPFTALPIQIFNWASRPQEEFLQNAAGAILVLLVTMLLMNASAVLLRARLQKKMA